MEQPLKPMSPPLVAHRLRRVKENRSLLRSVRISFPVLTSLCLLHYVFLLGVSAGHQGRCQEDTRYVIPTSLSGVLRAFWNRFSVASERQGS